MIVPVSRLYNLHTGLQFLRRRNPGDNTNLQPRSLPQCLVQPRLPPRPAGAEMVDHRLIEAERDETLGRAGRAAAADDLVADLEGGPVEHLVGPFGRVVGVNPFGFGIYIAHSVSSRLAGS